MHYEETAPPASSPVERIWLVRGDAAPRETILPDGRYELIFSFGDDVLQDGVAQPRALLAAEPRRAVSIAPSGRVDFVGITLRDGRAASILGAPLRTMRDRMLDLRDVSFANTLYERLGNANTSHERIAIVLDSFRGEEHDPLAERAALAIRRRAGRLSITRLASALGVTIRTLGRAFDRSIGITPKTLARVARLNRAAALLRRGDAAADVALEAGFSDQSHLVNEFRAMIGLSPSKWIDLPGGLADHFFQDSQTPRA